ncbi:hypothetical protein TRICI_001388 [Trichomonascus ciferrii]|uniref:Zn(2)-C6 fungal-type domain-containing protein n=1 Tax=Trichomonascus ciferrii TaxID=44093 RepID=A0A642VCH5_9ASCO|nr:hypothetical protein TRICI_001388 [Trichomonascus ciferrii]
MTDKAPTEDVQVTNENKPASSTTKKKSTKTQSDGKPRKRTSRACDQCNQLRTKCDGLQPCAHCISLNLDCVYLRIPQKRGKASQTYLESNKKAKGRAQNSSKVTAENRSPSTTASVADRVTTAPQTVPVALISESTDAGGASGRQQMPESALPSLSHYTAYPAVSPLPGTQGSEETERNSQNTNGLGQRNVDMSTASLFKMPGDSNDPSQLGIFSPLLEGNSPSTFFDASRSPPAGPWFRHNQNGEPSYYNNNNPNIANRPPQPPPLPQPQQPAPSSSLYGVHGYIQNANAEYDAQKSSPESVLSTGNQHKYNPVKYPVLRPVIDTLLSENIPLQLAYELLETYFSHSTHVLAYLVRERSVLSETNPRKTDPVLIYAMLLVAAHHSDHPTIAGTPSARPSFIARLTDLTTSHLTTARSTTASGSLDEVIAYVQLGTIVSASEYKGSSLRWWSTAIALAKELKLNHEVETLPAETREERRRVWWLLYMVDRHLGLCYNRPLIIMDLESADLYQPVDEEVWESEVQLTPPEMDPSRSKGISYTVSGQGIYGYFLPLMSILGALIDFHHAEQSIILPFREMSDQLRLTVQQYLDYYMTSLSNWNYVSCQKSYENSWRDYAWHLSHVLYVLSSVSWDPTELLENSDNLISSPEYNKLLNHAISGAKAIRRIFSVDPDLRLMPFFFGIYLLQGSFILLAIVDKVEHDASPELVSACETIVHAHEVCIATLDTEYQRNFRKVMRGTMSLLSATSDKTPTGISPISGNNENNLPSVSKAEKEEARKRRQYILSLYRWNRGGHGLAV